MTGQPPKIDARVDTGGGVRLPVPGASEALTEFRQSVSEVLSAPNRRADRYAEQVDRLADAGYTDTRAIANAETKQGALMALADAYNSGLAHMANAITEYAQTLLTTPVYDAAILMSFAEDIDEDNLLALASDETLLGVDISPFLVTNPDWRDATTWARHQAVLAFAEALVSASPIADYFDIQSLMERTGFCELDAVFELTPEEWHEYVDMLISNDEIDNPDFDAVLEDIASIEDNYDLDSKRAFLADAWPYISPHAAETPIDPCRPVSECIANLRYRADGLSGDPVMTEFANFMRQFADDLTSITAIDHTIDGAYAHNFWIAIIADQPGYQMAEDFHQSYMAEPESHEFCVTFDPDHIDFNDLIRIAGAMLAMVSIAHYAAEILGDTVEAIRKKEVYHDSA